MSSPERKSEAYALRMPQGMRERLRHRALANRRSINSEIIYCIDRALAAGKENGPAATAIALDQEPTNPR